MEIRIINKLIGHWKASGVYHKGSISLFNKILSDDGITLPKEFIELYQLGDGTSDYDNEGFLFYKYEDLETMGNKFSLEKNNPLYRVVLLIDYMQGSCWYGIKINPDGYEIGIIPEANKFKVVSTSLDDFLSLYIEDADVLYEYH